MGRRNYLIEGVSGTGKTAVGDELQRRGFHVVHGDRELAYQGDPATGRPVEGRTHDHHLWRVDEVRALVADHDEAETFFCGGSRNLADFLHLFDAVFVLEVDAGTLGRRLDQRAEDEWGTRPAERELVERLHRTGEGIPAGITIDATVPLVRVVDAILAVRPRTTTPPRRSAGPRTTSPRGRDVVHHAAPRGRLQRMDALVTRRLGRSDLRVSAVGLGCWPIGGAMAAGDQPLGYTGVDDAGSRRALARAADLGVTLFDTADAYGAGHSERLLGEAFGHSSDIVIATKFGNTIDEDRRQLTGEDSSPEYVRQAVHGSLHRLRREAIDLYQLHTPPGGPQQTDDLLATLEDLVDQGLVRWYGISSDDPAAATAFAAGPHCTAVQLELNVLGGRTPAVEVCERHDLAALGRSPLAMGLLSGRYSDGTTRLPAHDVRGTQPDWMKWFAGGAPVPEFLQSIEAVRELLTTGGRSLVQGALAWSWAASPLSIPLPGFRTVDHVESTAAAVAQGPLTADQLAAVEAALGRPAPQPPRSNDSGGDSGQAP